jgi:erythromycin esterase-like protein
VLVPTSCEDEVVTLLAELRRRAHDLAARDPEGFFDAEQNALIARNAEHYYRAMVHGGPDSWNVRDHHMAETLERLMDHYGPDARGIVWEHNKTAALSPLHVPDHWEADAAETYPTGM